MKNVVLALGLIAAATPALAQEETPAPDASPAGEAATQAALSDLADLPPGEAWLADPSQVFEAGDIAIDDFRWLARPIIVFADSPLDPAFQTQMDLLQSRIEDVVERDVILITDTDPGAMSDLRRQLRPRGFQLVLIGKDGGVKLRKPFPWDMRELSRTIDKMPMRQREMREGA
ncbi:MAG: DUF4174 domain-containing protein [Pseudomonadota bacterium]